jgi:hypothetical protein
MGLKLRGWGGAPEARHLFFRAYGKIHFEGMQQAVGHRPMPTDVKATFTQSKR